MEIVGKLTQVKVSIEFAAHYDGVSFTKRFLALPSRVLRHRQASCTPSLQTLRQDRVWWALELPSYDLPSIEINLQATQTFFSIAQNVTRACRERRDRSSCSIFLCREASKACKMQLKKLLGTMDILETI